MEDDEKDFDEAFKGFGEEPEQPTVTPPADDPNKPTPPASAPVAATPPEDEEPKKDDKTPPVDPDKKEDEVTAPADPAKKSEEGAKPPETPETPPPAPEEPKPLTADDVTLIISNMRQEERTSGKELENTTKDIMDAYYPEGLANVLVDQTTGKELRTPADVVAIAPDMSMEDAAQWLMNEQFKLDQSIAKIKTDAQAIAETTINFKRDSINALTKYEPLFKAYPALQEKTFKKLMKLVKADTEKSVVLSAPDVMEFYDDALEPYQQAYEYANKQSATNPVPAPGAPATPPAPGQEDRLDEGGDGGTTEVDDPNDFAQQVKKELAKGI